MKNFVTMRQSIFRNHWKRLQRLSIVCFCAILCPALFAQTTQQFTGHVLDSMGAAVQTADVVVHNQATGVDTKTVTTSQGVFTVPYLSPGTYTITVVKSGFKTEHKTDILLNVDQASTIDFLLSVGATTEEITVKASASQIELSKGDNGEIFDNERVSELPLDARNPYGLFDLAPGVKGGAKPVHCGGVKVGQLNVVGV
jgi:hypothetical protein